MKLRFSHVTRTATLLLAMVQLAAASSCASQEESHETTTQAAPVSSDETDEREAIREEVPENVDYDGYVFRIQSRDATIIERSYRPTPKTARLSTTRSIAATSASRSV